MVERSKRIKDNEYSLILGPNPIGIGTYGKVYKAYLENDSSQKYAVKQIEKEKISKLPQYLETFMRELTVMKQLDHPNLMKHYHTMETANNYYLILEFCGQGSLGSYLESKPRKCVEDEGELKDIIQQITSGMAYLHEKGVMHRDLKPENILISNKNGKNVFKIADFGFAKAVDLEDIDISLKNTRLGTPLYMAPEVMKGEYTSSKCDVWSCGIIFYELIYGCYPFIENKEDVRSIIQLYQLVIKPISFPEKGFSHCFEQLLLSMMDPEHKTRVNWNQVASLVSKIVEIDLALISDNHDFDEDRGYNTSALNKMNVFPKENIFMEGKSMSMIETFIDRGEESNNTPKNMDSRITWLNKYYESRLSRCDLYKQALKRLKNCLIDNDKVGRLNYLLLKIQQEALTSYLQELKKGEPPSKEVGNKVWSQFKVQPSIKSFVESFQIEIIRDCSTHGANNTFFSIEQFQTFEKLYKGKSKKDCALKLLKQISESVPDEEKSEEQVRYELAVDISLSIEEYNRHPQLVFFEFCFFKYKEFKDSIKNFSKSQCENILKKNF